MMTDDDDRQKDVQIDTGLKNDAHIFIVLAKILFVESNAI
jgi:hypothetical protein